jgi:hypothetical protein
VLEKARPLKLGMHRHKASTTAVKELYLLQATMAINRTGQFSSILPYKEADYEIII